MFPKTNPNPEACSSQQHVSPFFLKSFDFGSECLKILHKPQTGLIDPPGGFRAEKPAAAGSKTWWLTAPGRPKVLAGGDEKHRIN